MDDKIFFIKKKYQRIYGLFTPLPSYIKHEPKSKKLKNNWSLISKDNKKVSIIKNKNKIHLSIIKAKTKIKDFQKKLVSISSQPSLTEISLERFKKLYTRFYSLHLRLKFKKLKKNKN